MSRTMSRRILSARKSAVAERLTSWADLTASAVLGDGDGLVEGLFEQRGEILGSARPPSRIAGLALGETGMPRRPAIADLVVIALVTRRHRRPPCRRRGRQSCGRFPNGGRCRRSISWCVAAAHRAAFCRWRAAAADATAVRARQRTWHMPYGAAGPPQKAMAVSLSRPLRKRVWKCLRR